MGTNFMARTPEGIGMPRLRVLLVGPIETAAAMAHLLYLSHHDSRWEVESDVPPDSVRWCDVLIADIGLKGPAGLDFVRGLTAQMIRRPIVIVISSESQPPPRELGVDARLVKPVDPEGLLALVERLREFAASLHPPP
jgi:DNA-binding response OmpR family regulator